ncbi:hypothetical protein [Tardiphaga sp. vice278]|uniref:hypothetical protein n=1 Tax=Tardiphaga sp. vice278 TaxID=2592815 RepID=UPI001163440A|nr:hypothetical protein [Tardiphaga sp. vice278]QDM19227.1 hypothetical protein FNL53_27325 [Tardiphaga sp. vice278]
MAKPSSNEKHSGNCPSCDFVLGVVAHALEGGSSLCAPDQPVTLSIEPLPLRKNGGDNSALCDLQGGVNAVALRR